MNLLKLPAGRNNRDHPMTGNKVKVPVGADRRSSALTSKAGNSVPVDDLAIFGVSRREHSSRPDQVDDLIVKKWRRDFWDVSVY